MSDETHLCNPDIDPCEECQAYWERMKQEGFWVNGQWTDKAVKEWTKP